MQENQKNNLKSLILTSKAYKAEIIAFASTDKVLRNGSLERSFNGNGYTSGKENKPVDERHLVPCIWSNMDKVPVELIDSSKTHYSRRPYYPRHLDAWVDLKQNGGSIHSEMTIHLKHAAPGARSEGTGLTSLDWNIPYSDTYRPRHDSI